MNVSFTASKYITAAYDARIETILEGLTPTDVVGVGICIGGDARIGRRARERGHLVHAIIPANHAKIDPNWRDYCTSWEQMPDGTDYRDRNTRIVAWGDRLIGVALYPQHLSVMSGTWMTINIARRAEKTLDIHLMHTE